MFPQLILRMVIFICLSWNSLNGTGASLFLFLALIIFNRAKDFALSVKKINPSYGLKRLGP